MSPSITSSQFGHLKDGRAATLFTLRNSHGAIVQFTDFGAALVSAIMLDKDSTLGPVALGFDSVSQYEANPAYIGVIIGPVSNRISGAAFTLDGTRHELDANEAKSCLHSGAEGWHKKLWSAEIIKNNLCFRHETQAGDGGFPGKVSAQIDINFDDSGRLTYQLQANTTAPTPVAMTRHEYFNLTDGGANPIDDHIVQIHSTHYAAQNEDHTSNGTTAPLTEKTASLAKLQLLARFKTREDTLPFDRHNIVAGEGLRHMARVQSPGSGRQLDVYGTEDGIQFYTGQAMAKCQGAHGISYGPSHGFALEAQARPNAVNHPHFPSVIVRPGEQYKETIVYQFGLID